MTTDNTSKTPQQVLWFKDISKHDRLLAGGKGASLGEMTQAGLPIPAGYVISTSAFIAWLDKLDAEHNIRERVSALHQDRLDELQQCGEEIRQLIINTALPEQLQQDIAQAYQQLGENQPVAIRSSATSEDSEEASFAGLQDTYLWVRGNETLFEQIRACWASLYSTESIAYRRRLNLPEEDLAMAVVVQTMVDSACSGVMFTRSPTTGDRSVITIEASWGLGSSIVSGEVTPDRFVVNKVTSELVKRDIASKDIEHRPIAAGGIIEYKVEQARATQCCLEDSQLKSLCQLGKQIERHYGSPQDIEWSINQHGEIRLLQSRPETVWAAKDATPLARPAKKAFDHIFSALGGPKS